MPAQERSILITKRPVREYEQKNKINISTKTRVLSFSFLFYGKKQRDRGERQPAPSAAASLQPTFALSFARPAYHYQARGGRLTCPYSVVNIKCASAPCVLF